MINPNEVTESKAKRDDPKLLSLVANAIGWAVYSRDGRELSTDEATGLPDGFEVRLSSVELATCFDAAYRVLGHLDTYDQVEAQK